MHTYGRLSYYVFMGIMLPVVLFTAYLVIAGKVHAINSVTVLISIIALYYVAYVDHMVIQLTDEALTIKRPLKNKTTTHQYSELKRFSITTVPARYGTKQQVLTLYAKDDTEHTYKLPGIFMERKKLQLQLQKHVPSV